MYANPYDRSKKTLDESRVFARVGARSPETVQMLLERLKLNNVDELIPLLPHKRYKARFRERFRQFMQRLTGTTEHEQVVRPALQQLRRQGKAFPMDNPRDERQEIRARVKRMTQDRVKEK